jgi:diaminohydroxyphosphoribosylaminopyrimidine deaminase/5-amino-6-(5-phosphoribosylamino)uracil reductase
MGKKSVPEPDRTDTPRVGVVIVKDGQLLGESFRGEKNKGVHAEFGLLERLKAVDLAGALVYTTLEPCSRRGPDKTPCADHLIDRKVSTVFIGMFDPNPKIYREGWKRLRDAGINLRDFDADLRTEIQSDNQVFVDQFRLGVGPEGEATFDYMQRDGQFEIRTDPSLAGFRTRWSLAGKRAIYALDYVGNVAHARYATSFDEVDDPGALEFASYSRRIGEGEIAVFRNDAGYALVRVERVLSGHEYDDDRTEVHIRYQLRLGSKSQ